ncbi:hypothetical protein [Zunongwangia sp. HRR-M8]|uniref:hypothetical protein n=1 Tax=Zunongwangia sp. HRR-M8 TaxID=3015170 RepID=UPI0022DD0B09|nr:hypothetical protein [Zunongwangia sp. HRR-M8]WBL21449.1 hypothetical protein PBT89_11950 [Zunongwangia sp. HRR-M8]
MYFRKTILVFFSFFFSAVMSAQEIRLKKGDVTDNIRLNDSIEGTYAVYLPQNYDAKNPPAVIFILDPDGNAKQSIQLFRKTAEEQSYVIASSNRKIDTASVENNIKQVLEFMNGFFRTVPVDPNSLYVAGFNEAGQIASALPLVNERVTGVLAINNAWINPQFAENRKIPYTFSAIVGTKDYTRYSVEDIIDFLDDEDFPSEINYFEGGPESWPDTNTIYNAVASFTLNAINNGKRQKDSILVNNIFESEIAAIESLRRERSYYTAWLQLKKAEDKFDDYDRFDDQLKDLKKSIRKNKAFKQQRRDWYTLKEEEMLQRDDYTYFLETDVFTANFENIGWWASQLDNLKEGKSNNDLLERNKAFRLEGYLKAIISNAYKDLISSKASLDLKIYISILETIVDKENPEGYLSIIKLAGHDGDYQTAMLYLEDLLKTGYDNYPKLYELEGILDLQMSNEFNQMIEKYGGTAKYLVFDTEDQSEENSTEQN